MRCVVVLTLLLASSAAASPTWPTVKADGFTYACPPGWTCQVKDGMVNGAPPAGDGLYTVRARTNAPDWLLRSFDHRVTEDGVACGHRDRDGRVLALCARTAGSVTLYTMLIVDAKVFDDVGGLAGLAPADNVADGPFVTDEDREAKNPPPPPPPPPPPADPSDATSDQAATADAATPKVITPATLETLRTGGKKDIPPPASLKKKLRKGAAVVLKVCLEKDGTPALNVLKRSGVPAFDDYVEKTITASWRFKPFVVDGEPVPVCTSLLFKGKP